MKTESQLKRWELTSEAWANQKLIFLAYVDIDRTESQLLEVES